SQGRGNAHSWPSPSTILGPSVKPLRLAVRSSGMRGALDLDQEPVLRAIRSDDPVVPRLSLARMPHRKLERIPWVRRDKQAAARLAANVGSLSFGAVHTQKGLGDRQDRIDPVDLRLTLLPRFGKDQCVRIIH